MCVRAFTTYIKHLTSGKAFTSKSRRSPKNVSFSSRFSLVSTRHKENQVSFFIRSNDFIWGKMASYTHNRQNSNFFTFFLFLSHRRHLNLNVFFVKCFHSSASIFFGSFELNPCFVPVCTCQQSLSVKPFQIKLINGSGSTKKRYF